MLSIGLIWFNHKLSMRKEDRVRYALSFWNLKKKHHGNLQIGSKGYLHEVENLTLKNLFFKNKFLLVCVKISDSKFSYMKNINISAENILTSQVHHCLC